jgi:hypothetical protein
MLNFTNSVRIVWMLILCHRYNFYIRLFLPSTETMPDHWIFFRQMCNGGKRTRGKTQDANLTRKKFFEPNMTPYKRGGVKSKVKISFPCPCHESIEGE